MKFDYVDATRRIVTALNEEGLILKANELDLAIRSASTGGELLDAVRFYLSKIDLRTVSDITGKQIERVLKELNVLRP